MSGKRFSSEALRAEVRQMQKAEAVLACIQFTAEYDNEPEADLADAIAVVGALIGAVIAALDAGESEED